MNRNTERERGMCGREGLGKGGGKGSAGCSFSQLKVPQSEVRGGT